MKEYAVNPPPGTVLREDICRRCSLTTNEIMPLIVARLKSKGVDLSKPPQDITWAMNMIDECAAEILLDRYNQELALENAPPVEVQSIAKIKKEPLNG